MMNNQSHEYNNVTRYKVSGFDLILTMASGQEVTVTDGVSKAIIGELFLRDANGKVITKDDIASKVRLEGSALDSVFLGDLIKDAVNDDNGQTDEQGVAEEKNKEQDEKIHNIINENQQLKEQLVNKSKRLDILEKETSKLSAEFVSLADKSAVEKKENKLLSEKLAPDTASLTSVQKAQEPVQTPSSSISSSSSSSVLLKKNESDSPKNSLESVVTSVRLSDETDSGLKGDFTTNSLKPVLEGETYPGVTVELSINGRTFNATSDSKGHWSIPVNNLQKDGTWNFDLSIKASGGSYSTSGALTVDRAPPAVNASLDKETDSGLYSNDNVTNVTSPVLTGITKPGSSLNIILAGNTHTISADPDGNWAFKVPGPLSDGIWQYTITAIDQAGNTNTGTASFTIDTSVSALTAGLSPVDIMEGTGGNVTASARPLLSGEVEPGSEVKVIWHGAELRANVEEDGKWSLALTDNADEGVNDYTVIARDIAGNERSLQGNFVYSVSGADDSGSLITTIALSDETDSGLKGDFVTNNSSPVLVGKTSADATVTLVMNGKTYQVAPDKNDGTWSINVGESLSDGLYNFSVQVSRGEEHGPEQKGHITIDTVNPSAYAGLTKETDTGLSSFDNITSSSPDITGVTKPWSQVAISFKNNDSVPVALKEKTINVTADASGKWLYHPEVSFNDGTYHYDVTVTDSAGNSSSVQNYYFTIDSSLPGLKAALAAQDNIAKDGDKYDKTNSSRPMLAGEAKAGSLITISLKDENGNIKSTHNVTSGEDNHWKFIFADSVKTGINSYSVEVTSVSGIKEKLESQFEFIPTGQSLFNLTAGLTDDTDTGTKGDNITSAKNIKIGGSTEPEAKVTVTIGGKTYAASSDNNGKWVTEEISGLGQGVNYYTVVSEHNGDTVVKNAAVVIDRLLPDVKLNINGGSTIYNERFKDGKIYDGLHFNASKNSDNPKVIISGETKPGSKITFTGSPGKGIEQTRTIDADDNGKWSLDWNAKSNGAIVRPWLDRAIDEGGYYTTNISVTDIAGNTVSKAIRIVQHITPPKLVDDEIFISGQRVNGNSVYTNAKDLFISGRALYASKGELFINNKLIKEFSLGANGEFIVNPDAGIYPKAGLSPVKNNFKIKFYSIGGVASTTKDYTLNVFNQSLSVVSGIESAGGQDNNTTSSQPVIIGKVLSGESGKSYTQKVTVRVTIDSGESKEFTINNGEWSVNVAQYFNVQKLDAGMHNYKVFVTDDYGNAAENTGKFTILPFDISLEGKDNPEDPGYFVTKEKMPVLSGRVSEKVDKVTVQIDGQDQGEATISEGRWSFTVKSELENGQHNVTVRESGSNLDASLPHTVTQSITVDTVSPGVTVSIPQPGEPGYIPAGTLITGTTEPGSTVYLSMVNKEDNTTLLKQTVADGKGDWSYSVDLPDGDYDYSVYAVDIAGNKTDASVENHGTLHIDSTSPTGLTWGINENAQFSSGIFYTNSTHFSLTGNGESGTNVTFKTRDGKHSQTVTIDQSGKWKMEIPSDWWADNSLNGNAVIINTDKAGNTNKIDTGFYIVTAPQDVTAQLLQHGSDAYKTSFLTPTFIGKARPFSEIKLMINNQEFTGNTDQSGSWSISIPEDKALSNLQYPWTLTAKDAVGIESTAHGSIQVDNSVPVSTLEGIAESSDTASATTTSPELKSIGKAYYTDKLTGVLWQLHGKTSSPDNQVTVKLGNKESTAIIDNDGHWTADFSSKNLNVKNDSKLSYAITVTNKAGGSSTEYGSLNIVSKSPDTTSYLVSEPGNGYGEGASFFTREETPVIKGQTADGASVSITLTSDSVPTEFFKLSTTAGPTGSWSVPLKNGDLIIGDGTWKWKIKVTDLAGRESESQQENSVTIQRSWISPSSEQEIKPDVKVYANHDDSQDVSATIQQRPWFKGNAAINSDVEVTLIDENNVSFILPRAKSDASGKWSVQAPQDLQDGKYSIDVKVFDKFGNQQPDINKNNVAVEIKTMEHVALQDIGRNHVAEHVDDNSVMYINEKKPVFKGTAANGDTVKLSIKDENGHEVTNKDVTVSDYNFSITPDNDLSDGKFYYTITVKDSKSGAEGNVQGSFNLDTVVPELKSAEIIHPADASMKGEAFNVLPAFHGLAEAGSKISITVSRSDGDGDGNGKSIQRDVLADNEHGNWSWTPGEEDKKLLQDGHYTWNIKAVDLAGNESSNKSGTFVLDTTAPSLEESKHHDVDEDYYLNNDWLNFEGTSEAGATVFLSISEKSSDSSLTRLSTTVQNDGKWSIHVKDVFNLKDGDYSYKITAVDKAGNHSESCKTGSFSLNNNKPELESADYNNGKLSYSGHNGDNVHLEIKNSSVQGEAKSLLSDKKIGSGTGWDYDINSSSLVAGSYKATLTVTDNYHNEATKSFNINIPTMDDSHNLTVV
ncbi:Ig-like domain repeat protein [Salmonella enterica]|nr:Ig-like domain repeat protein [Salmonella enterica]